MNRRRFLSLLGATALTPLLPPVKPEFEVFITHLVPYAKLDGFIQKRVSETWYMEDGTVLEFPAMDHLEWRT